jgi:CheY-like chemotaxis protein
MSRVRETSHHSRRVLLVEDDQVLRKMLARYLREQSFTVDEAQNGLEALEQLDRCVPDVTLLDLSMPQMDGPSFVEYCRQNPRFATVPIVVFSGTQTDEEQAKRIGARAYLMKPIDLDVLHAVLERVAAS